MWWKFVGQIVVAGAEIVGRAFTKALRQEFQSAAYTKHAAGGGKEGAKKAATNSLLGMTEQEAKLILNVKELDAEKIQKNFEYLFKVNDKKNGGSFYLQSKVYRAKERLDSEFNQQLKKSEAIDEPKKENES